MAFDYAGNNYLFGTPRKEVVVSFCDQRGLQNEYSPFPTCFNVKSDKEGSGIFFWGKIKIN